ncbi:oxidoreductase-like domain-containing protein [Castellaniella sp.]|uniref:oxidoreductase-like domain-containing protein n=1 Tax=Castellaniella sp. TaxID=1955812 RepID=UPI00355FA9F2
MNDTDPTDDPRPCPPEEPDLNACCGNGCTPCVFDIWAEEKRAWEKAVQNWESRQRSRLKTVSDIGF